MFLCAYYNHITSELFGDLRIITKPKVGLPCVRLPNTRRHRKRIKYFGYRGPRHRPPAEKQPQLLTHQKADTQLVVVWRR